MLVNFRTVMGKVLAKEVVRGGVECIGNENEHFEAGGLGAGFNFADVLCYTSNSICEFLLRKLFLLPAVLDPLSDFFVIQSHLFLQKISGFFIVRDNRGVRKKD